MAVRLLSDLPLTSKAATSKDFKIFQIKFVYSSCSRRTGGRGGAGRQQVLVDGGDSAARRPWRNRSLFPRGYERCNDCKR